MLCFHRNDRDQSRNVKVRHKQLFENVRKFMYLATIVTNESIYEDIKIKSNSGNDC